MYIPRVRRIFLLCSVAVLLAPRSSLSDNPIVKPSTPVPHPSVRYLHHDATGNLAAVTDESGTVLWRAKVRPFGASLAPADRPPEFAGQPRAQNTWPGGGGVYLLGMRSMAPTLGRFLTPDPLFQNQAKLENPQRFNRYSYALANPYRYEDASGLEPTVEQQTSRRHLQAFFSWADAQPHETLLQRAKMFMYGPVVPPGVFIALNNDKNIRNSDGNQVDLDWGARLAGYAALLVLPEKLLLDRNSQTFKDSLNSAVDTVYFSAKQGWNAIDVAGTSLSNWGAAIDYLRSQPQDWHNAQASPWRLESDNTEGIRTLVRYVLFGGDVRDYFDPATAGSE